ncbi:Acetylpolyamine aminohydrolase [Gemmata obscuriglobus]|uniref:Histone deacetylase family protein n=1 Tax=Gemmata obscuriglobus TaxID=114 RepID=A0A2Z3HBU0_9BACT|nr:histone deacetylase family protein [Gemmata obscuriglobus]AWM41206.1 histone deacetylase family protein [Gemmata obscuriglobus]QEG25452.1 Acetylpolyamine aminohydrolase [Gemmata obscuriglobus]VTR98621.1 Histone deacetylase superfamily protein OS=uncultured bacterium GN=ACD_12C00848G0008 PE=4 SV=1: Hist_deacetyl [Gemmata obscuriglobus UQM 2246]
MRVILNSRHADHAAPGEFEAGAVIPCHEAPGRCGAIRGALEAAGGFTFEDAAQNEGCVAAVHHPAYVAYLRGASAEARHAKGGGLNSFWPTVFPFGPNPRARGAHALRGTYCFDVYTPILPGTFGAALGGASAAFRAAELVAAGAEKQVYVLTRPPGHHAEHDRCGGYCYFNNAAVAAQHLSRLGKVAVLDLDVHHGNGTQHIFYDRADVLTVSVHGDPAGLYPFFSGFADETGTGAGLGANVNVPLPPGTGPHEYRPALARALDAVARFRPEFLVLAFGADTHEADPIGGLKLPTGFFGEMGAAVRGLGLPTVIVQEGGYDLGALGASAVALLGGFEAR